MQVITFRRCIILRIDERQCNSIDKRNSVIKELSIERCLKEDEVFHVSAGEK